MIDSIRHAAPWSRLFAAFAILAVVLASGAVSVPRSAASDQVDPAPEFTASKQISRVNLVGGKDDVVEQDNFSLSLSNITNLRDHQTINVSWTGAHPTGGILPDPNSGTSAQDEYPVVLLECRGTNDASAPAVQQVTPETCWTGTPNERFQSTGVGDAFPPYRVDRYADPADRQAIVGAPQPRPDKCSVPAVTERWIHFQTAAGVDYPEGPVSGCGGLPPEAVTVGDTLSLPSNTTYAATELDGRGTAKFDVWTSAENTSLGCSQTVACSLVAVPILGISCDIDAESLPVADRPAAGDEAATAQTECQAKGQFAPGSRTFLGKSFDLAVSGALWWSASNWRNRISVPLQFAPPSNVCDVVGSAGGVDLYGSELMAQATAQWTPHFCLDPSLFKLHHVQLPEPQARAAMATGSAEGVLSSAVPDGGFTTPTVNAPVAMTGFAVSFLMDDANQSQLHQLRLTPRLLAKLLTESYPGDLTVQAQNTALTHNPLDITADPEFQALNPDAPKNIGNSISSSTLVALGSDSDVTWALTAYINADPEARSFLDGTADPWGMTVNPAYKGISLPSTSWPLLDTFVPQLSETANPCLFFNPVPFAPLIAAPMSRLSQIAQALQFGLANSTTSCYQPVEGNDTEAQLKPIGRQFPGFRFMLGITSLADAQRYGLDTAELQTQSSVPSGKAFTDATGRTFVAPTDDSLRAAAATLKVDDSTHSWPLSYSTLNTDPSAAGAYPGAMVVYAQVPTTGLPADDAKDFAQFLRFAVTDGQTPGYGNGQLPPGFLPLTAANGLGDLASYTLQAANDVESQDGRVPGQVDTVPEQDESSDSGGTGSVSSAGAPNSAGSTSNGRQTASAGQSAPFESADTTTPVDHPQVRAPVKLPAALAVVATLSYLSGLIGRLLPWLIIGGLGSAAVGAAVFFVAVVLPKRSLR